MKRVIIAVMVLIAMCFVETFVLLPMTPDEMLNERGSALKSTVRKLLP